MSANHVKLCNERLLSIIFLPNMAETALSVTRSYLEMGKNTDVFYLFSLLSLRTLWKCIKHAYFNRHNIMWHYWNLSLERCVV